MSRISFLFGAKNIDGYDKAFNAAALDFQADDFVHEVPEGEGALFWSQIRSNLIERQKEDDVKSSAPASLCQKMKYGVVAMKVKKRLSKGRQRRWRQIRFPVIKPQSNPKVIWDLSVGLLILYSVVVIPYRISFTGGITTGRILGDFDAVVDCVFGLDMFVTFFTAYMDDDRLETTYQKIAKRYFKTWFAVDLLSTFPFDRVLPLLLTKSSRRSSNEIRSIKLIRILRLFRLLKLMRLARLRRKFENIDLNEYISPPVQRLLALIGRILFIAHLIACMWHYVNNCNTLDGLTSLVTSPKSIYGSSGSSSWLQCGEQGNTYSEYIASFYWTITTIMAVGYGDILAVTTYERAYAIGTEVIGATAFGFIIAMVAVIVESMDPQATAKRAKIDEIREYMSERRLPKSLQRQIKRHFDYLYSKVSVFREVAILRDLPMTLRIQIMNECFRELVHQLRLFEGHDVIFVTDLVFRLKPMRLDYLSQIGHTDHIAEEVYIVVKGRMQALARRKNQLGSVLIAIYTDGSHFELASYVFKSKMEATYHAAAVTDLMWLDHEDLSNTLERYPGRELLRLQATKHQQKLKEVMATDTITIADFFSKTLILVNDQVKDAKTQLGATSKGSMSELPPIDNRLHQKRYVRTLRIEYVTDKDNISQRMLQYTETEELSSDLLKRGIIDPLHPFKQRWDLFIAVLIILSIIVIPLRIGFSMTDSSAWVGVDYTVDCFFGIDIIMNFRTAFEDEFSVYVTVPKFIRDHYLKTWFLVDFFSTVPFDRILERAVSAAHNLSSIKLIRTLRLVRLLKLMRILKLKKLGNAEDMVEINAIFVRAVKLLLTLGFVGHLFGCFWSYISTLPSVDESETWWSVLDIESDDLLSRYIASIYWAFTTMTTTGYGDIVPVTDGERIYASAIMIMGATVFGYIVGSVSTLASNPFGATARQQDKLIRVHNYLDEQKIQTKLRSSVKKHVEYHISQKSPFDEKKILSLMPQHLRRETILQAHSDIKGKICLFTLQEPSFVAYMLQKMRPQFTVQEVDIVSPEEGSDAIYFLTSGIAEEIKVEGTGKDKQTTVQKCVAEGQIFGYESFLGMETRNIGYRAFTDCTTYALMESEIAKIIENQPVIAKKLQKALKNAIINQTTRLNKSAESVANSFMITSSVKSSKKSILVGESFKNSEIQKNAVLNIHGQQLSNPPIQLVNVLGTLRKKGEEVSLPVMNPKSVPATPVTQVDLTEVSYSCSTPALNNTCALSPDRDAGNDPSSARSDGTDGEVRPLLLK